MSSVGVCVRACTCVFCVCVCVCVYAVCVCTLCVCVRVTNVFIVCKERRYVLMPTAHCIVKRMFESAGCF